MKIDIDTLVCTGCGRCIAACRRGVLRPVPGDAVRVADAGACRGCQACSRACPHHAITVNEEHTMKKNRKHAIALLGGAALLALLVAAVMWLWNALIPEIIGWKSIDYWQALGLVVLTHLLLGHLARPSFFDTRHRHLHEQLHGMSRDEKREFIRRRMQSLYRHDPHDDTTAE